MRRLLGELLLSLAVWVEGLAVAIGDEHTAQSFLESHKDPRER